MTAFFGGAEEKLMASVECEKEIGFNRVFIASN
jgi:hypothetical protein